DMWNPAKAGAMGTSGSDIWAVLNGSSSLTSRELQGDGIDEHLAYTTNGGNAFWFLSDHLGSIRTVVDSTGAAVHAYSYDAFGNVTSVATPNMYAWTGRELDAETGLQYNRARYYDPTTGRWISLDPMGFDAGDSNLYRYSENDSTNTRDPSGMFYPETHKHLTTAIVVEWLDSRRITDKTTRDFVLNTIVDANLSQDLRHASDFRRHYNRKYYSDEWNLEKDPNAVALRRQRGLEMDAEYELYLASEVDRVNLGFSLQSRLEALGRLSHSWQDFFAHAIRLDMGGKTVPNSPWNLLNARRGRPGSENSYWPGFNAYSINAENKSQLIGDPYHRRGVGMFSSDNLGDGFIPSSYAYGSNAGEHPILEPIWPGTPEYQERVWYCNLFVQREMFSFLDKLRDDIVRGRESRAPIGVQRSDPSITKPMR
ncbi:MAG TPA: RHS repeat-associated core domain-containing protein, partial [Gemmataceae bacterium]|nr:RHS repeat-associated core domain-containing protein [Gemmataceae bacterium]